MRTLRIRMSEVEKAISKANAIDQEWRECPSLRGHGDWQARLVEIARIPKVWKRLCERSKVLGMPVYYGEPHGSSPRPFRGGKDNLPGYVWKGWNSEPYPEWEYSHAPGTAWNGIRREMASRLVEALDALAHGQDPKYYRDVLEAYCVVIEFDTTEDLAERNLRTTASLPANGWT